MHVLGLTFVLAAGAAAQAPPALITFTRLRTTELAIVDLDEVRNRVVIGLDVGAHRAAAREVARDLGLPAEAVEFEVTGPYVPQQTLRDEFRPIQGGIQIQRIAGTSPATCTLGFTAVRQDQDVFLTAGHCSPDPDGRRRRRAVPADCAADRW